MERQKVMERGEKAGVSSSSNGGGEVDVVAEMMGVIEAVGLYVGYRRTQRKECLNLVRRLKLLLPLLEEIKEIGNYKSVSSEALKTCLVNLDKALLGAKKLLKKCSCGSKIYLAMESEAVMSSFHAVYDKLNQALDDLPYDELGISVEVKEQASRVAHLNYHVVSCPFRNSGSVTVVIGSVSMHYQKLSGELNIMLPNVELTRMQLKRAKRRADTQDIELAMDMMVVFSKKDDRNADSAILERLASKLELHAIPDLKAEEVAVRKLVKERGVQNAESIQQINYLLGKFKQIAGVDETIVLDGPFSSKNLQRCRSLLIPHEFLCPITLEIMVDPVIVATGQTYERESIQKWLNSNHRTCPKTGSDGISAELIEEISSLVQNLSSCEFEVRREAIKKIRMLAKENPDNRVLIANYGGIPPLVQLLSYQDSNIQEHAVTALLNLSIDETNKILVAREGAIPAIVEILQHGTNEARENSAAALFSLSMLDENKVLIGALHAIRPLVHLLQNGTVRGKKDAATALFNLSLNQTNKSRAIKAGRNEIGKLSFIKTLVEIIRNGTPKNKECALSVLLQLGLHNSSIILAALQYGVYEHLVELAKSGTNRAQRKANSILQHISKYEHIP
ncbi:U BOX DOMAIN-CONTAINING [Salix viminalis]|uniref:RING-type E3 ubiquitin transferase n=1 Tax=Salix viminalis TaxID=40686 RepID=A0A9Q0NLD5_SALVM|nr:U BOX DOMAIN-CONTAINING [Salix viminalis]